LNNEKKFLDQTGVEYLWSKIDMQDYPNNETLVAVINAIDENKADKEYVNEQIEKSIITSWNDLEDRPFGETITPFRSGSNVIPAGSTTPVRVIDGGVGYLKNFKRYIHDNAIIYGIIDGVTYYLEDVQSITDSILYFCTIDDCTINLGSAIDRKTGLYAITASVKGNLGRDLAIELFYSLLDTKTLDPKFLPKEAQPDWSIDDETNPAYIKNKPTETTDEQILEILAETDMIVAVSSDGNILTDEQGNILEW
jgi:hypothetical protein